jgi:hypothetical protein
MVMMYVRSLLNVLLRSHSDKLGIAVYPNSHQLMHRLLTAPARTEAEARAIFEFLSTRISGKYCSPHLHVHSY